ncbi:MAG: T9SS type A sorting domain-containing protein, partial [Bacteroidota bacterium]
DHFWFAVTDGEGGLVSGKFVVKPAVGVQTPGLADFDLAPNPAASFATFSLAEALDSDSRVSVFNAAGQAVRTWHLSGGTHNLRMDLQGIPQGVYVVALENDTMKLVKKLVISVR